MIISFIIPAYKASSTLGKTLDSVFCSALPDGWQLDVIVADDGSPDCEQQKSIAQQYDGVTYLHHANNQGKCAAVNMAVPHSRGDVVIMLDADDTLIENWPTIFAKIANGWPSEAALCFSACTTHTGQGTVSDPHYSGLMTYEDMLNERFTGEYLPIFKGDALRAYKGYRDPGMAWGCEMWTYLGVAKEAPIWITSEVLRIYHFDRPGSVTHTRNQSHTASQIARCYDLVFEDFGEDYQKLAPVHYRKRRLRQAVYTALSGNRPKAFKLWLAAASFRAPLESCGALALIVAGRNMTKHLVGLGKSLGLIKKFG